MQYAHDIMQRMACNECGNSHPKQSVYDIRLHTKIPATKNYMEL